MACKLNTPEWISLRVSPAGSLIKSLAFLYEGVLICIDKIETFDIDVGSFVHVGLDVLSRNPVSSKSITFWCTFLCDRHLSRRQLCPRESKPLLSCTYITLDSVTTFYSCHL